jgi:hypothetical protein
LNSIEFCRPQVLGDECVAVSTCCVVALS